ncbi:MAG: AIPR family protein [Campylobacteraceae bacterium]|jgi:hypothetical protein|nr:AIPR family protein [Campylobacteraceae bacterium]
MDELQEFHEELFNEVSANACSGNDFLQRAFFEAFCEYLDEAGEIEMPEYSYYKDPQGRAINGYYLDENESGDGSLNLFISIYSSLNDISTINKDEIESSFKRIENFFIKSLDDKFYKNMEETSDGYSVANFIYSRQGTLANVNLYLLTDKKLSSRLDAIPPKQSGNVKINYHLWDLTRLYRLISSERVPQDITIDFNSDFGDGIPCLPANLDETEYKAYLAVVPGIVLAKLYERHGARLLERNVRSFLQTKGKINKGIRETILSKPERFFAYNNGITATAESIDLKDGKIQFLTNLQIVNGGQTTASLFSTYKKDKADISRIFVQMKLSVVSQELGDEMIPCISKYANSQNKVNEADFFATHHFHKRMEDFSRRIYAPSVNGQFIQTKWFYERARGQYINGYSYATPAKKNKFQIEYPKSQLFTKTDLAKFEGVWMQLPHIVSKGAQYIFLEYANKVDKLWNENDTQFNEAYYKIAIAKAIVFKATEKLVTNATWYDGGYRANIVAYTLAYIAHKTEEIGKSIDFMKIWNKQAISEGFKNTLKEITKEVHNLLLNNGEMSNIGQFCKRLMCWTAITKIYFEFKSDFLSELISINEFDQILRDGRRIQRIDNGIDAQRKVCDIPKDIWKQLKSFGVSKKLISDEDIKIIDIQIKKGYVSVKQSQQLLLLIDNMKAEGFSAID